MKPSTAYRIKLGAIGAFGAGALVLTGALALSSVNPDLRLPVLTPLGVGAEARADRAANAAHTAQDLERALALNHDALEAAPMNAAAWLRIAYLRSQNGRRLDAESLKAIENSYSVAPFGPDVSAWRLSFLYDRWGQLSPAIREEATAEHYVMTLSRWRVVDPGLITNPSGRMAATFTDERAIKARRQLLDKQEALAKNGRKNPNPV